MAQQLITLEEAAQRLGISPEEMKKRLKTDPAFRILSQVRDGATIRFKVTAIDELGRELGIASEDGQPRVPRDELVPPDSDDFKVKTIDDTLKEPLPADEPIDFGSTDDDVFSLAEEPKPQPQPPKTPGKLTAKIKPLNKGMSGSSDSDVLRLNDATAKNRENDESAILTEEIALDFSGPGSVVIKGGSSAKLSAPKSSGSSGKLDAGKGTGKGNTPTDPELIDSSSEFELSLDADSDDFDLQMNPESDEVALGSLPKDKAGSSAKRASNSGINLSVPADSGISLEKGKTEKKANDKSQKEQNDSTASDVDFELSLDSSAVASGTNLGAPKSGKQVLDSDSDSEFELTLDDSGGSLEQAALEQDVLEDSEDKGDIFETDFEIPAMPDESASEAVALESDTDGSNEDFELQMDDSDVSSEESGSEVVLLDDEEEGPAKSKAKPKDLKGKKKAAPAGDDDVDVDLADDSAAEDDESVSKALKGAKGTKRSRSDEDDADFAATKPWGIVPVLFLAPALLFVLAGALMGFEMLQTMWGYQQPRKPSAPIVRGIASQLDMELKDQ